MFRGTLRSPPHAAASRCLVRITCLAGRAASLEIHGVLGMRMHRLSSCPLCSQSLDEVDQSEDEDDGQDAHHEARHCARADPVYPVQLLLHEQNKLRLVFRLPDI